MRMKQGYLDRLDLGTDKETGEGNILVKTPEEFHALTEEQKERAWATIAVASKILNVSPQGLTYRIWHMRHPAMKFKADSQNKGLIIAKVEEKSVGKAKNGAALVRIIRRVLNRAEWLTRAQREGLVTLMGYKLRMIEQGLNKGGEGKHEPAEV